MLSSASSGDGMHEGSLLILDTDIDGGGGEDSCELEAAIGGAAFDFVGDVDNNSLSLIKGDLNGLEGLVVDERL